MYRLVVIDDEYIVVQGIKALISRLKLDYDPASCILPLRVERGIVTEAAFVSECMMEGKPAVYLQTHTCKGGWVPLQAQ